MQEEEEEEGENEKKESRTYRNAGPACHTPAFYAQNQFGFLRSGHGCMKTAAME